MKALMLGLTLILPIGSLLSYAQAPGMLVPSNASWRYLVTSTRPDASWIQAGYDDAAWPVGMAELGYGDGDEATVVGFGPDVNNKYITTYFRAKFNVSDVSGYRNVSFDLEYDDGAVVYLNGNELYRVNMPAGTVGQNTPASTATDYPFDTRLLPVTYLVTGENVVAVEVHQGNNASSDMSFALEIKGQLAPTIAITSPADNTTFTPPVNFTLSADASDADGSVANVEFYNGNMFLGYRLSPPFNIGVSNLAEGPHVLTAQATDNEGLSSTSATVVITVNDPNPPTLSAAVGLQDSIEVHFSKNVVQPSATEVSNYGIPPPVTIFSAQYGPASNIIQLSTSYLTSGNYYTLTVNDVHDRAGNVIAPNSQINFQAQGFISQDIGFPSTPGSFTLVPGGLDVTGAGTDIGGTSDQFQFSHETQKRLGDFDLRVRVASFSFSDTWAKAALMARESLDANSTFAAAVATPSVSGSFFSYRAAVGGLATNTGNAPVTYPNTWLRLKREANTFSGYTSFDGNSWSALGAITLPNLPPELYVGMAVTSHQPTQTATAQFRDYSVASGGTIGALKLDREPLGPASRRTGLVISEIYYGEFCCVPPDDDDDDDGGGCWDPGEFIEIYNSNPYFEDLSGFQLAGNISHRFPQGTRIKGGEFLVLRLGEYGGSLTGCEGVRLLDRGGAILAEVTYRNTAPWPLAERTSHSIVLSRPSYGQNNPKAWSLSDGAGGSPGAAEPFIVRASDGVRINELTSFDINLYPASLELYNRSSQPVDLSGYIIAQTYRVVIPDGTIIPAGGFLWWQTGSYVGVAHLITPDGNHIIDSFFPDYGATGVSGRYPDGADHIATLSGVSLGEPNDAPHRHQVVINEIMYAPISGDSDDEYIELYNNGPTSVDVSGWWIASHGDYSIPSETILGASNYLVLAKNPQRMLARYGHLSAANVVGGFSGELDDDGGRITIMTSQGDRLELTYGVGGQWGNWSRGGGSSLELKDPDSDGRFAHNWADSDESGKGVWTTIEAISSLGEALGSANDSLQIFLLGAGECLVDEVEVRGSFGGGLNLVQNAGFESGLANWFAQGSHDHSVAGAQGFAGAGSLNLRAATRGDNGANRIRSSPFSGLAGPALLRAKVKWIRGSPEIALRLHGGTMDVSGRMQIQPNGTPGARNSRAVDNAGPAIAEVSHAPLLPAANEAVHVMAMASDPDGLSALALKFRLEPSATYVSVPMLDNGIGGDTVAGDGIYTATVPGQPSGARIGFYLEAIDGLGAVNTFPQDVFPTPPYNRVFPTDAHNRECIVRWGETMLPGSFGTYFLWLNATNTARWTSRRPVMNNTPLDGTFVYNNSRVIYNVRPAYHSSDWHRGQRTTGPDGTMRIDYSVDFAASDPFLGATEALWIHPGNIGGNSSSDSSAQAEPAANTILRGFGLQNNYQRYVHVFVNGSRRDMAGSQPFIMQDAQRPNVDSIDQWSPGDRNGDLIWLEDWFEYPDNGDDFTGNNDADLMRREITLYGANGQPRGTAFHMGAYRFMFRLADVRAGRSANDYSTLFALLNTVTPTNGGPIRLAAIEPVLDYQQWMRMFAAQHAVGNWDTYGYDRGRNAYMYRSSSGRVQMWAWKNNFTLGIGGHAATTDMFGSTDQRIVQMWREPNILRAYWEGFYDLIRGPLRNEYMDPILDARATALQNNGVSFQPGQVSVIKNFIRDRRTYLAGRMTLATNVPLTAVAMSTNGNVLTLRGTAPIQVQFITINGAPHPVSWSAVSNSTAVPTNWTTRVVLQPGLNNFTIAGYDSTGALIRGPITVHAEYNGPVAEPQNNVIISEIMYRAAQPKAEYVELYNKSANFSFDLFRWRLDGLEFEFPAGAILGPNQFMVLAKDLFSFGSAFASQSPAFAYSGELDSAGETLSLTWPYGGSAIDRVRYESVPPWPPGANGGGSALQVVDMDEDNSRVSNWTDGLGWRQVTFTGTIAGSTNPASRGTNFFLWLGSAGTLHIDDITLVLGTTPEAGVNLIANGDFEAPLAGTWTGVGNHSGSFRSTEASHSGSGSLKIVATGNGSVNANFVRQHIPGNTTNAVYTLSFWFLPTTNGSVLYTRTAPGSLFQFNTPITPIVATPGQSNSFPQDLPPYDPIWLNEIWAGEGDRWLEIYNAGTTTVSLDNYWLADNYDAASPLPLLSTVAPGEFKVFPLDAIAASGALALTRVVNETHQLVDYFNYPRGLYGALPDGQPFTRGPLRYPTPGLSNLSPRIRSIVRITQYIYLTFEVIPGYRYNLEYKDALSEPAWRILLANHLADEPDFTHADEPPGTQRFYRLTLIP